MVAEEGDEDVVPFADEVIRVPADLAAARAAAHRRAAPGLRLQLSTAKGLDVDQPRNLAKTVTVE